MEPRSTSAEHLMATDIDWDPTGRYVATAGTSAHGMGNLTIWSSDGKILHQISKDHFHQFLWRPVVHDILKEVREWFFKVETSFGGLLCERATFFLFSWKLIL